VSQSATCPRPRHPSSGAAEVRRGITAAELASRARPRDIVGRLTPDELTRWLVGGGLATTHEGRLYTTPRAHELGDGLTLTGWH
jgi:hypothetical protein